MDSFKTDESFEFKEFGSLHLPEEEAVGLACGSKTCLRSSASPLELMTPHACAARAFADTNPGSYPPYYESQIPAQTFSQLPSQIPVPPPGSSLRWGNCLSWCSTSMLRPFKLFSFEQKACFKFWGIASSVFWYLVIVALTNSCTLDSGTCFPLVTIKFLEQDQRSSSLAVAQEALSLLEFLMKDFGLSANNYKDINNSTQLITGMFSPNTELYINFNGFCRNSTSSFNTSELYSKTCNNAGFDIVRGVINDIGEQLGRVSGSSSDPNKSLGISFTKTYNQLLGALGSLYRKRKENREGFEDLDLSLLKTANLLNSLKNYKILMNVLSALLLCSTFVYICTLVWFSCLVAVDEVWGASKAKSMDKFVTLSLLVNIFVFVVSLFVIMLYHSLVSAFIQLSGIGVVQYGFGFLVLLVVTVLKIGVCVLFCWL